MGRVALTYNSSTGENCVVAWKTDPDYHGNKRTYIDAKIDIQHDGKGWFTKSGYWYHWESVTRYARGQCVKYHAMMTTGGPDEERYARYFGGRRDDFDNCGS